MKILVLINEDFTEMVFGKNSSLAHILAAIDLGHDVFIYNIANDYQDIDSSEVKNVISLNKDNASWLIKKYKIENQKIVDRLLGLQNQAFADVQVGEFFAEQKISLPKQNIYFSKIDFVIQRLEPMKAPFPPVGNISINDFLLQLKTVFPKNFIFNFQVNSYADKELPLVLSKNYQDLATPTAISFSDDSQLPEKLLEIAKKYSEIFSTKKQKIVVKPDDSAQALGVFAVEIKNNGLNLDQLKTKTIAELIEIQLYEISSSANSQDINEIINILCFVQFCKTKQDKTFLTETKILQKAISRNIKEISQEEIFSAVKSLYGKKILLQPFLEGVRLGDIRINLAKMSDGNFKVVGAVFRKSLSYDERNFTTCLTTGASTAQAVESCLSELEEKNLTQKIKFILQQLNHDKTLKQKYQNVMEIGCDFLIVGNGSDVYFGEANHYCPALVPFSESLERAKKTNFYDKIYGLRVDYEGGLAVTKKIISEQIALQNQ